MSKCFPLVLWWERVRNCFNLWMLKRLTCHLNIQIWYILVCMCTLTADTDIELYLKSIVPVLIAVTVWNNFTFQSSNDCDTRSLRVTSSWEGGLSQNPEMVRGYLIFPGVFGSGCFSQEWTEPVFMLLSRTHEKELSDKVEFLRNISIFRTWAPSSLSSLSDILAIKKYMPNKGGSILPCFNGISGFGFGFEIGVAPCDSISLYSGLIIVLFCT